MGFITSGNSSAGLITNIIAAAAEAAAEAVEENLDESVQSVLGAADAIERLSNKISLQCDGKIYGVKFPLYTTSGTPTGTRTQAAEGMTAGVSTDTVAAANDFDYVPLFRNTMVNGYLGEDGEFVETAVEGDLNFARDGSNGDVYSRFRLSFFRYVIDDEYEELQVTDTYRANEGWCPFGIFIKPDGKLREYAYIAAYEMGYNSEGLAASISGVPVAHNTYANRSSATGGLSHNTQRTEITKKGTQYCGMTTREVAFLQFLFYVEFATRNSQAIMQGATDFNSQVHPTVAENGVTRVIVSNANAAKFPVGCTVSVGIANPTNSSIDRGNGSMHGIINRRRVLSQEAYDDSNTALTIDTDDAFDTTTNCYISTMPWYTGITDGVKGSSGSYISASNAYYPMKYRGIENLYGNTWTIMSDVIISNYIPYICYDNSKYQNAPNDDYSTVGYTLCSTSGWVRETGYDAQHPSVRLATVVSGNSTTYYCDYYYISAGTNKELLFGGNLHSGANAGVSHWGASLAVSSVTWAIAARLSVSGQCGALIGG